MQHVREQGNDKATAMTGMGEEMKIAFFGGIVLIRGRVIVVRNGNTRMAILQSQVFRFVKIRDGRDNGRN